jgi:hypothetical protein
MNEFSEVARDEHGSVTIRLLQAASCRDNCWNRPTDFPLAAGTSLKTSEKGSNDRGDLFFKVMDGPYQGKSVTLPRQMLASRYPYDKGAYDPTLIEVI